MTQRIDLTGNRYHHLTVLEHVEGTRWRCRCDCGGEAVAQSYELRHGRIKSCGCMRPLYTAARMTTHGQTDSPTYRSWLSMRRRCYEEAHPQYHHYGGRGISVCERWRDSFENFRADMGERPDGMTLDRYPDKNGNYEPTNCRWATHKEQMMNTSRNVVFEGKTIAEWARELGVHYATVSYRLRKHGTVRLPGG